MEEVCVCKFHPRTRRLESSVLLGKCDLFHTDGDVDKDRALSPVIDFFTIRDYDILYNIYSVVYSNLDEENNIGTLMLYILAFPLQLQDNSRNCNQPSTNPNAIYFYIFLNAAFLILHTPQLLHLFYCQTVDIY